MMPMTMLSFWAIYALERKPGEDFSMNGYFKNTLSGTYIIPLMNDHVSLKVEKLINKFYNDEDLGENSFLYGIDFDEAILLNLPHCVSTMSSIELGNVNTVYVSASFDDGGEADLFFIKMTSDECWKQIFERYDIKMDMLISSDKGLGNWFPYTQLYSSMCLSSKDNLLPPLFFEGNLELGHNKYFNTTKQMYHKRNANVWEIDWKKNKNDFMLKSIKSNT